MSATPWYRVGATPPRRFDVHGVGIVASTLIMIAAIARAVAVHNQGWTSYTSVTRAARGIGIAGYADEIRALKSAALGMGFALVVLVVGGVTFLVWLYRARVNVEGSDVRQRLGTGWTVGAWFVPLANVVLPLMVVADVWRASAPVQQRGTGLVDAWWAAVLLASGLGIAAALVRPFGADPVSAFRTAAVLNTVEAVVTVLAASLLVVVIVRISRWQRVPTAHVTT